MRRKRRTEPPARVESFQPEAYGITWIILLGITPPSCGFSYRSRQPVSLETCAGEHLTTQYHLALKLVHPIHHVARRRLTWPRPYTRSLSLGRTLGFRRRILYGCMRSFVNHAKQEDVANERWIQAIGGTVWHGIKGFRNSPYSERMIGCTSPPPSSSQTRC